MRRLLMLLLVLGVGLASALAVDRMTDEEVAVRERHDQAIARRNACLTVHNVETHQLAAAKVCLAEQEAAQLAIDAFNELMRAKQDAIPHAERRRMFVDFEKQYSVYPVEDLQRLQRENCLTKWGGHDSLECQAIASQIAQKKRMERLPQGDH